MAVRMLNGLAQCVAGRRLKLLRVAAAAMALACALPAASAPALAQTYQITNPDTLFVDAAKRRAVLAGYGDVGRAWTRINPYAGGTLPTVSATSVNVNSTASSFQSNGKTKTNIIAGLAFSNLTTSEGYTAARFGVWLGLEAGTSHMFIQFRPTIDTNLANIPGLTSDIQIDIDPVSQSISFSQGNLASLPSALQRTMLGIISQLPAFIQNAGQFSTGGSAAGFAAWDRTTAIAKAQTFLQTFLNTPDPTFAALPTYTCDVTDTPYQGCQEQSQVDAFAQFLTAYGADYLSSGARTTAATIVRNLRAWADGNSLLTYPGFDPTNPNQHDLRIKYEINTALALPLINTWMLVRNDAVVTPADKAAIEGWIGKLVGFSTIPYDCRGPVSGCNVPPNNHGDLMQSVVMAWGVMLGDSTKFTAGMQRYLYTLNQINSDGSIPLEDSRGACALRYHDLRIESLVTLAEMAAAQGYDLYSTSVNGVTLHTAVKFLLDATDNQSLVAPYAAANGVCNVAVGAPQETDSYTAAYRTTNAAWVEAYVARFPYRTESQRLRAMMVSGLDTHRPVAHPVSAGNTTAMWAVSPTPDPNGRAVRSAAIYASTRPDSQSYLRFFNTGSTAGTATATLYNAATGQALGQWTTPSIPPQSEVQFSIAAAEAGVGLTSNLPPFYTLKTQSSLAGYFQHVLYRPADGTLTNLSTCAAGVTADAASLSGVHSSLLGAGFPSSVVVNNTSASAQVVTLDILDARNGTALGTYATAAIPGNGQKIIAVAEIEAAAGITPAIGMYHYVMKARAPFTGYLQHLVNNTKVGVITDMTTACSLDGVTPPAAAAPLRDGAIFSTAQSTSQSFLRFYNTGTAPGAATVNLRNYATGDLMGTWTSPAIAAGAEQQFDIATVERGAGISGAKPDYYAVTVSPAFNGYFQHVLFRPSDGTVTNLSTCGAGVTSDTAKIAGVHSSLLDYGFPSTVVVSNTGANAATVSIGVYDARDGAKLGTYTSASIPPGGQRSPTMAEIEAGAGIKPAGAMYHYVLKVENAFTGFLQNLVNNLSVGVVTDMTTSCRLVAANP